MPQRRRVAVETEPHVYEVDLGGEVVELRFRPEVTGVEFADAQQQLAEDNEQVQEMGDRRQKAVASDAAIRRFLAGFMVAESAARFVTWDKTGKIVKERLTLPEWVMQDMTRWVVETYTQRDPTGSGNGSSPPPPPSGKPSTAGGRPAASTRKRGR